MYRIGGMQYVGQGQPPIPQRPGGQALSRPLDDVEKHERGRIVLDSLFNLAGVGEPMPADDTVEIRPAISGEDGQLSIKPAAGVRQRLPEARYDVWKSRRFWPMYADYHRTL